MKRYENVSTKCTSNTHLKSFFLKNCCAGWWYLVAFTKILTIYQIYRTGIHSLYHSSSSPSPLIPGKVSTGIIFPFTSRCVHHIHPPSLFPHLLLPSTGTNPPPKKDLFCLPVLRFCIRREGEEKCHFWLFKMFLMALPGLYVS
jgi:hypothetical protein